MGERTGHQEPSVYLERAIRASEHCELEMEGQSQLCACSNMVLAMSMCSLLRSRQLEGCKIVKTTQI